MNKTTKILSEYGRLLREAENSRGLDEEKIPQQIEALREEFKKLTGNNIEDEI